MRAIWKGAISFGLVNVPVKLYSATESHDLSLHQVHHKDGGRIRYQRRCDVCDEVVPFADIDRAYDDGTRTVVVTKDDFAALPAEKNREIDVIEFVPAEQIDPLRLDASYYLEPDDKAVKPYSLLRQALGETDRVAVVKFALRQRTRLALLRVTGDVLTLQTMLWDDEIRAADFDVLDKEVTVTEKELAMAGQLIDSLSGDLDTTEFTDDYQVQLKTLIDAKIESGDAIDTEATFGTTDDEGGAEVVDLMEALRRSVEERASRKQPAKKPAGKARSRSKEQEEKPA